MSRRQLLSCYSLGWVTGLLVLVFCRNNQRMKYHGLQAVLLFGSLDLISVATRIAGLYWGHAQLFAFPAVTALFMLWLTIRAVTVLFWVWVLMDAWHSMEPVLPGMRQGTVLCRKAECLPPRDLIAKKGLS